MSLSIVSLPVVAFAILIGACGTLLLPNIPPSIHVLSWLFLALSLLLVKTNQIISVLCLIICGFGYMALHINNHLQHSFATDLEGQQISIVGTISSIVTENADKKLKFLFNVNKISNMTSKWRLPAKVQLSWDRPSASLKPGDTWKLLVKLKRPRNYANPGSFDIEKMVFQQRIVAFGHVLASKDNSLLHRSIFHSSINKTRQYILSVLSRHLNKQKFSSVIIALILGVKASLSLKYMDVLQTTGTAHLLAISGLHIGICASMCFFMLRILWRYVPVRWLFMPAPWLAACGAICISSMYAILSGLAIATQRALIMLIVSLLGVLLKRKVSSVHGFCLALLSVLLIDPFAIMSMGFWFSFTAVGLLIYALSGRMQVFKGYGKIYTWLKMQLVMTVGMLPLNLLFFGKSSVIAPIANVIAIPWVSFIVLPFSILAALLTLSIRDAGAFMLLIAEKSFGYLWPFLTKLAQLPSYAWQVPEQHWFMSIFCAVLATFWLFMPRGIPGKCFSILGFMPLFFVKPIVIPYGQAEFTLLDVGQGLSAVVRTKQHVLVYDTGAKLSDSFDLGSRVVAPYLQSLGIKKLDTLLISHADNDHIGGALGLLNMFPAKNIITNDHKHLAAYQLTACIAGYNWEWDGVTFTILHPDLWETNKKRNDQSCVLMVQAGEHKLLLTGDIEKRTEQQLIKRYGQQLQADLMLVPHHGSKTSSSLEFLQIVRPKYALIPVGYKNRYGHPKPEILQRYHELNIAILRSEYDGAISFRLGSDLLPHRYRRDRQKFWNVK